MGKIYHYHQDQSNNGALAEIMQELAEIKRRHAAFEKRLSFLESRPAAASDQARMPYGWGDQVGGDPYYHRQQDLAGAIQTMGAWTSTTQRIVADLTSSQTARRTLQEACLAGIFFTTTGGFLAALGHLPWFAAPIVGVTGASLSLAVLVAHNRTLLHKMVNSQAHRNEKRRQELRVQIDKADATGRIVGAEFLFVSGITREQLVEFAPQALHQENLSVNLIGGGGKIFTQGQAQALGAELELLGLASAARGPVGRRLTAKGRAFFRGLAEQG